MFGLTKREQRWAAEQKAAETIVPLLTAAIEARTAMDTNDRIAALERGLTQAVQMYTDAAGERDKALADLAAAQARIERYEALLNRCSDACKVVPVLVRNGEHISLPTHIEKAIGKDRHEG